MRNLASTTFGACVLTLATATAASAVPLASGINAGMTAAAPDRLVSVGYRYYGGGYYYRPYRAHYYGAYRSYAWSGYHPRYAYAYPSYYSSYYAYPAYTVEYAYPTYYASYGYPYYYYPQYGYRPAGLGLGFYIGW